MKKLWSFIIFLNLLHLTISGQKDYFSTDSTISIGIKLVDGGNALNSRFCQVKERNNIIQYSPYEVKEFGFKDGRVYLSKEIQLSDSTEKVFLERLYKGRASLYYLKNKGIRTFFVERDSSFFVEISKINKDNFNYQKQLLDFTLDCSNVKDAINFVNYNKKSLSRIIKRYNNCELKPFPHFRYGLIVGYEIAKLIPVSDNSNEDINYFDFSYDGGFLSGLFIDWPISVSYFSLHTEFYYSRHGYSYNKFVDNKDLDFVVNISSLKLPVLIRYTYPSNKFRPFINAGGIVTFNTRNENLLYKTTIQNNTIEINDTQNTSFIGKYQSGYSVGAGIEYSLNPQRSLFIEVRYNNLLDNVRIFNESVINLMTGINF
jgi:opacity protein-like surface antigen